METILSLDIETTGLDEHRCQILEFGAVIGDFYGSVPVSQLPSFKRRIIWKELRGDPYAMAMNADKIKDLSRWQNIETCGEYIHLVDLWKQFRDWLNANLPAGQITITGKNFGSFDRRFLSLVVGWDWNAFSYRFLDPGSLFFDPRRDAKLPDLLTCATRANVDFASFALHEAVEDARLVVAILRSYYKE